jgi:hypothetical protein
MAALAALPEGGTGPALDGPITAETLKALPIGTQAFSAEDFTKFFLEPDPLLKALERYQVSVRRRFQLLCFAITLRDLDRDRFLAAVGAAVAPSLLFNPFEAA